MNRRSISFVISIPALLGATLVPLPVIASDDAADHKRSQATVSFGRGLNTAQEVNHAVLPKEIKIKAGGVVDFSVAGFHDVVIFKPGFTLADLLQAGGGEYPLYLPTPTFPPRFVISPNPTVPLQDAISYLTDIIYYRGINPAGGPLATAVTGNPANGSNRTEPVAFLVKGTYLVICNVRPHLLHGMYAYVKVD